MQPTSTRIGYGAFFVRQPGQQTHVTHQRILEIVMPGIEDAPREIAHSVAQPTFNQTGSGMLKKTHPMIVVAAVAVTLFSAVGIGVMTGVLPSAGAVNSSPGQTLPAQTGLPPSVMAAGAAHAPVGMSPEEVPPEKAKPAPSATLKPVDRPTLGQPLAKSQAQQSVVDKTSAAKTAKPQSPSPVPSYSTAAPGSGSERGNANVVASNAGGTMNVADGKIVSTLPSNPPADDCRNCGTVDSVLPVRHQGQGSGAGAVIGGVLGGVLGRQVGSGRGRDVATVAGAVGGAVIGNSVEKSNSTTQHYEIRVRLTDGTMQTVKSDTDQGMRIGDKVRIDNGRVIRLT